MIKGKPIIILLVEDDPAHAEIVRRNLADFRVANRIIHVEDGQAALDYLFRQNGLCRPPGQPPAGPDSPGPAPAQGGRPGGAAPDQGGCGTEADPDGRADDLGGRERTWCRPMKTAPGVTW